MMLAIVVCGFWVARTSAGAEPPTTRPTTSPSSRPATQPADDARIATILERMEAMGDRVEDLRCRVEYRVQDLIGLDEFTKFGRILYKRAQPNPLFFIEFDKMHQGGIVLRRHEWYLFKDRWLDEAKEASRTVIHREVIREGDTVDLFSLEKTPFPMPFGQRKDEILRHFRVTVADSKPGDPPSSDHLICVPRSGSRMADEYSRLEFYVSRSLHLPVKIVAFEADPNGEPSKIITASFPELSSENINAGLALGDFTLPPETKTFTVIEEPLEGPASPQR
jgi:hypothetical protein